MSSSLSEELEYASQEPVTWHQHKHDLDDFCKRMKIHFAKHGDLERIQWMHENCTAELTTEAMDGAATNGHLDVVQWLHEAPSRECTATRSSTGSFTNVMQRWTCGKCTTTAMDGAAMNGHLNVLKWLHKNREEGCTTSAMDLAAQNGHFNVVLWLHCNREEGCTFAAIDGAASNGFLLVISWLKEHRSEGCTAAAMLNAASKGFLEVVEYLHTNLNQQATNAAITAAASNGHLSVVKYLHDNHSEHCTADAITQAKKNGHDAIVEFLLRHEGCRRAYEEDRFMAIADNEDAQTLENSAYHPGEYEYREGVEDDRAELEARLRVEEEAKIRVEEEPRIRAEVEATIRAEQEEVLMRAKIRAEIQAEVEEKMRAEIRTELLAKKNAEPSLQKAVEARTTASSTPPPVQMINSNPVLEMTIDETSVRLILTTDVDGIVVCEDANTSRRDWLVTDSEFDNARKRLRYELHWVSPEVKEREVQVPSLGYSGRIKVGVFRLDNQEMRMAAVAYYLGSLNADGFIGARFSFGRSPIWEIVQETASYVHSMKKKGAEVKIKVAESIANDEVFDKDDYVWTESFVSLGNGSEGIFFPIYAASFVCNVPLDNGSITKPHSVQLFGDFSSSWDVVVDFNVPCLELPKEFYDVLAGWIGLRLDSRLGLSEVALPASALPDLLFSLSFTDAHLALPLQSLVLPELSDSSSKDENWTKICIQRSASMLQRGTAAFAAPTTTAAEVERLQRLHGVIGIPVYNMIDSPIVFGAMVLEALGSVVFDGATKRTGIRKPSSTSISAKSDQQNTAACMQPVSCIGGQEYVTHLNNCQDPDCSQYYFHGLDEDTKHCVINLSWTVTLAVTTTLFVTAELFFSLSLRRLVFQAQQIANSTS
ncbi:hypothetical protein PI124_g12305 [Phytophthora idaei]|nr:hypothetical protein PI125_g11793 [Phytophthora idaei]KAG3151870.1 hypothetical protein PI126_g10794 [Phytophthora idaei]KAG3242872.1 hypothetical protein PI124_g12305 [Phytophthora idaei]